MASVRFTLRDTKAKRKTIVRMSVSFDGNRIVIGTKLSISPEYWDHKIGLPKSVRGSIATNSLTKNLKILDVNILKLYDELSNYEKLKVSPVLFKQKLLQLVYPEKYTGEDVPQKLLVDFISDFIKDCDNGKRLKKDRTKLDSNTIKTYTTLHLHFTDFQNKIKRKFKLNDFCQQIHDEFLDYLEMDLGESRNTTSKYISNLRQVILYAVKLKLIPSSIMIDVKFETGREDSDNIFLNEKELQLLLNLKSFNTKLEEEVRDIFVLGCYTGLRFSNYSQFNVDYLNDEIYSTISVKVNSKVSIPIHQIVRQIINKYNNKLPICPTNQEFNRTLKDLGKRIPELNVPFIKQITRNRVKNDVIKMKWEMIMTHTARRSFCTNMYLMDIPETTIMAISGHKSQKRFRGYIKADGLEHAQIMKKYWDENTKNDLKLDETKS
jgi:site-specific recombinase XerD